MTDVCDSTQDEKAFVPTPRDALNYTPLECIKVRRPVGRIAYISTACNDKRVLDLGALDETAFGQKTGRGTWLHEEITKAAKGVIGIDSSSLIPDGGLVTAENAKIMRASVFDIDSFLAEADFQPDVVVAGELIEHLESPLHFLQSLRNVSRLKGSTLLFSTPNATAIHNCLIALSNRESTHADHLCILSYKTLNTLLFRAGYKSWEIVPYHAEFAEMKERSRGIGRTFVTGGEIVINLMETIFPLVSFGFIVTTCI